MNDFENKTAIITGGSDGIGLEIAKELARLGSNLIIIARNESKLEKAISEINKNITENKMVMGIKADIANIGQATEAIEELMKGKLKIDFLFNNAGIAMAGTSQELNLDQYRKVMEINYFGLINLTKIILPYMISRRSGHIINISSFLGITGLYGQSAYSASKHALVGYSESMRQELLEHNIRVSVAFPADTDTNQYRNELNYLPLVSKKISKLIKVKSASEVARSIIRGVQKRRTNIFCSKSDFVVAKIVSAFPGISRKMVDVYIKTSL